MTSTQSDSTGREGYGTDLFKGEDRPAVREVVVSSTVEAISQESRSPESHWESELSGFATFGARLRAAREARGLDILACGHALHLPSQLLRQLEAGEYNGIDYQVYLTGYLTKYARHLGVDEAALQLELGRLTPREPSLVVTGGISHSRYLLERYTTAATYVVLTAVIVVPMIWLGVRGTLDRDMARVAPLDASPVAQQETIAVAGSNPGVPKVVAVAAPPKPEEQPLLASMAMFPPLDTDAHASQKPVVQAPTVNPAEGHSLSLSLPAASWVEVTSSDGSRLEYGLLPAGTEKTYHSANPLEVRIGNATGAQVKIDGQSVGLDSFRRANVARFRIEIKDGQATPVGS